MKVKGSIDFLDAEPVQFQPRSQATRVRLKPDAATSPAPAMPSKGAVVAVTGDCLSVLEARNGGDVVRAWAQLKSEIPQLFQMYARAIRG